MPLKFTIDTYQVVSNPATRTETSIQTKRDGAGLRVWHHSPYCPGKRNAIISEHVDDKFKGKGMESKLLRKAVEIFGKDSLASQFCNEQFVIAGYEVGFRTENDDSLEKTLHMFRDKSSVFMIYKPKKVSRKHAKKTAVSKSV